jgi:DNA modification methylase
MNRAVFQAGQSNGFAVSRDLNPKLVDVNALKPLGRQTRKHPSAQIRKLGESLEQFGFVLPIVTDADRRVVGGWGLVLAARKIGLGEVPAVTVTDLDEARLRLLRLALNRLGEESSWDVDALKLEFSDVLQITSDIDLRISGFEMGEIDVALSASGDDEEDVLQALDDAAPPLTKPGDLWILGDHRLLCGDALVAESYVRLLGDERAQIVFTDPPWNIPIAGNVSGLGSVKHDDFAMACGEMTATQFETFLRTSFGHAAAHSDEGSIQFICMHWSKIKEVLAAASDVYAELKNLCVWNKTNAGMGSLYRSKHELLFVFKKGTAPHINNIELGRFGRNRTNVWDYPGQNIFNGTAKSKLSLHPTAKPIALVADAIRDCSHCSGIVLDPFGGVGATLIAAEKTGRKARLIELDPRYVDATIKRWETFTGARAVKADVADWNAEVDRGLRDDETATNDAHASEGEGGAS